MDNQSLEKILVGAAIALMTVFINQTFSGNINYLWVGLFFVLGFILVWIYQGLGKLFTKYRVDEVNVEDGVRLLARKDLITGVMVGEAWQFQSKENNWAVYGPYIGQPLNRGKYRAEFRLKINQVGNVDRPVLDISVASNCGERGGKQLGARTLSTLDFKKPDEYETFHIDFYIKDVERELEFRVWVKGTGHVITLDYAKLSRKLF